MQNTFSQSGNDSKWFLTKIIFQNRYMALETPSRPPPLHGKCYLKFPFWFFDSVPKHNWEIKAIPSKWTTPHIWLQLFWIKHEFDSNCYAREQFAVECWRLVKLVKLWQIPPKPDASLDDVGQAMVAVTTTILINEIDKILFNKVVCLRLLWQGSVMRFSFSIILKSRTRIHIWFQEPSLNA